MRILAKNNLLRSAALLLLIGVGAWQSSSQGGGILLSSIPAFGQAGTLTASMYGVSAQNFRPVVYYFVPDYGWTPAQGCGPVPITGTGEFSVDMSGVLQRYATRINAYLIPVSLPLPCPDKAVAIPFELERNAVARVSLPRIRQYKTINFSGLEWYVKTAPVRVSPGSQFFSEDNAYVDSEGRLHLRITRCSDTWCAAEVYTKERVGYGTYSFTIESQLNNLDPNTTLGLFTWDEEATAQFHREWDIEFARWGDAGSASNAQYVVQPYSQQNNMYRFLMSPVTPTTHQVTWSPSQVTFTSSNGPAFDNSLISQWSYSGGTTPVPTVGDTRLHLNFYIGAGSGPAIPVDREVIISRVNYSPSEPRIGYVRSAESAPFVAGSFSVPIESGSPACTATVESDSPWLTVAGPNPVTGGSALQYSVADNRGPARTGNLVLNSTNCNLAMGRQILTVTQAGLVCDASFENPSTHIGFIGVVRSILVRATAPSCTWTVSSSAPWLRIVSNTSGAGNASVQVAVDPNSQADFRETAVFLSNGKEHRFLQDASGAMLAISPAVAPVCSGTHGQFSVAWVAPAEEVEVRLLTPRGPLAGRFRSTGIAELTPLPDNTLVYLVAANSGRVLASARTSVRTGDCTATRLLPAGVVNAASYSPVILAAGGLATAFGTGLASGTVQPSSAPFPETLAGATVSISGVRAPISFASPSQINFVVPDGIPRGRHLLTVGSAVTEVIVGSVSPGIFTANGRGTGAPVGTVSSVLRDGTRTDVSAFSCNPSGCTTTVIAIREGLEEMYFVLYGTGLRNARSASASVGPVAAEVLYSGASPQFPGVDQVNLRIRNFEGLAGRQQIRIRADEFDSDPVDVMFQ